MLQQRDTSRGVHGFQWHIQPGSLKIQECCYVVGYLYPFLHGLFTCPLQTHLGSYVIFTTSACPVLLPHTCNPQGPCMQAKVASMAAACSSYQRLARATLTMRSLFFIHLLVCGVGHVAPRIAADRAVHPLHLVVACLHAPARHASARRRPFKFCLLAKNQMSRSLDFLPSGPCMSCRLPRATHQKQPPPMMATS